jgi:hypothetical protein
MKPRVAAWSGVRSVAQRALHPGVDDEGAEARVPDHVEEHLDRLVAVGEPGGLRPGRVEVDHAGAGDGPLGGRDRLGLDRPRLIDHGEEIGRAARLAQRRGQHGVGAAGAAGEGERARGERERGCEELSGS